MADRVGFIGLGSMGSGMAQSLRRAGFALTVCDTKPEAVAILRDVGASVVSTARDVADAAEIVFASLPSREVCREIAFGPNGIDKGRAIKVYVETSTIGKTLAEEFTEKLRPTGIGFLDSPVSGGKPGALAGTLTSIVSGSPTAFERAKPQFDAFSKHIFYLGEKPGLAQIAKLVNNAMNQAAKVASFESVVMGAKAGIDPKMMIDIINVSSGQNYTTLKKFPKAVLTRSFDYGGHLSNGLKDVEMFLDEAKKLGTPLWVAPHVLEMYRQAAENGYLEGDFMRVYQFVEKLAGLPVDEEKAKG